MDFLEHEMLIPAQLGLFGGPGNILFFPLNCLTILADLETIGGEQSHITIFQIDDPAGIFQNGRDIWGQEVFSIAYANDKRAILTGEN